MQSVELTLPRLVIPGLTEFARGGPTEPPSTDDGNDWQDGWCWLYCGRSFTRVMWIGPVSIAQARAGMFACGPCIAILHDLVWQHLILPSSPPAPPLPRRTPGESGHRQQGRAASRAPRPADSVERARQRKAVLDRLADRWRSLPRPREVR